MAIRKPTWKRVVKAPHPTEKWKDQIGERKLQSFWFACYQLARSNGNKNDAQKLLDHVCTEWLNYEQHKDYYGGFEL